ncbi:zinc finger RNA-binding protein [Cocos nucifera]|uniref:Zinc finger RNA-binding protein n=1 Tax=Cocos nucifera TaxID=13894 RepID=A0A8K0NAY5_COCNU|nr:zinc finger RNA-binding protein [Cocos nucifera]
MDYGSRWAEPQAAPHHHLYYAPPHFHPDMMHHHQQPQPLPHSSSSSSTAAAATAAYYYPNPNPYPNPNRCPTPSHDAHLPSVAGAGALRPPAADIYPPNSCGSHGGYQGLHAVPYSYPGAVPPAAAAVGAPSSYYYGGGGEDRRSLAVKEAIQQYGVDPHGYGPVQASSSNGLDLTDPTQVRPPHLHGRASRPTSKRAMKKGSKRAIKVVQSAYCEVCKIECYTPEVLKTHKQGKKHKKMLKKLQDSITAKPAKAPTTTVERKETPDADKSKAGGGKTKKGAPATAEDLEAKKRRVLEGGAAAEGVKVCGICNVVVNSQKVFEYHIAGQRHTAMVKKLQEQHQAADAPDIVKE